MSEPKVERICRDDEVRDLQALLKDRIVAVDMVAVIAYFQERIRYLEDELQATKAAQKAEACALAHSMFGVAEP